MTPMPIDSVTLSVIRARLETIADEMDVTMFRSALSPIIADSHDACHVLCHPVTGGAIAQGVHGHPIFVGIMSHAVSALIRSRATEGIREGDVYMTNDPWTTGTHVQDMKVIAPVFVDGRLFCFVAASGHWTDMGGPVPGNWNPTARDFHNEGLRVPFVRIVAGGELQNDILSLVLSNIRLAGWAESDLRSQIQVLTIGMRRVAALCAEFGYETVSAAIDQIMARTCAMLRKEIAEIPDGDYSFEDTLDNDGIEPECLPVKVTVRVRGEHLTLDFSQTSARSTGPFNLSRPTFEAACFVAIKHVFADVPANAGVMEAIEIVGSPGSLLDAVAPAAVGAYTEVSLRVIDAIFGALAKAIPERLWAAAFDTVCSLVISGRENGREYVAFLYFGGGLGGSAHGDGLHHGPSSLSNSYIASVELVESRFPLRFREWGLRADSGGDGRHRGGVGSVYEIELLAEHGISYFVGDRASQPPFGICGGMPAAPTEISYRLSGTDFHPPLLSKASAVAMRRGDTVLLKTPGGGGYGDGRLRNPRSRESDRIAGYVTGSGPGQSGSTT